VVSEKLCINCQHYVRRRFSRDECRSPKIMKANPVTGKVGPRYDGMSRPELARLHVAEHLGHCGPSGRFFEPKDER